MSILILGLVAWWIAEGSFLIQNLKWFTKTKRMWVVDCPKCLGFWIGLFVNYRIVTNDIELDFNIIQGILVSCVAIFVSKIYDRVRL